ncbi:uncharacterized protein LOC142629133 [Castanea sativa]|uniref:uncharacterized protein LOC142629133 n=1 Tax=Castanea sativa TaxID=21020 RepID=UPI003F651831
MLAKQGWRLLQDQSSLLHKCFKAQYFPRSNFLIAGDVPNSSYVWKSIIAAQPILKKGCCWRVGDGSSIKVTQDRWITNYPTNRVVHLPVAVDSEWRVSDLIDKDLQWWDCGYIEWNFHSEDAAAILRIPLSRRQIVDSIFWLHNKNGVYSECRVAHDVWAGGPSRLQKCTQSQRDIFQLFEDLLVWLTKEEFELFLVQGWLIWNQRKAVIHEGRLQEPARLNKRAHDYLEEYQSAQNQLQVSATSGRTTECNSPHDLKYKLNFDAAIFSDLNASRFGAIIRNERGEVMAALSAKGPLVYGNEKVEVLACRKALEFAIDAGFSELAPDGDNASVMNSISFSQKFTVSTVKWSANSAAHSLARFARDVSDEVVWLEEPPPLILEALYFDSV